MSEREREQAEQRRERAEVGRVEQEDLRQIGEGGQERLVVGNDHETGRVEAEEARIVSEDARVIAEARRMDLRHFYLRIATAIALPLAFIALVPAGVGIYLVHKETESRCEDAKLNRTAIRDTLLNSFASLGYRYDEKTGAAVEVGGELAYYEAHPKERARALENSLKTVGRFPPITC